MRVLDIAQDVRLPEAGGKRANKASPSIAEGLKPKPLGKLREGIHELSPEQTLSLFMPVLQVGDGISGYQRDARKTQKHVRQIAKAIEDGIMIPTATVAKADDGYYLTDGGHRGLASIMTRSNFRVEIRSMNEAQQRELFHNQTYGQKLRREHSVLTGDTSLALYVQDVFTAPESAWDGLITLSHNPRGKLTPAGLESVAAMYGSGVIVSSGEAKRMADEKFSEKFANELAHLIRAFGTPSTNPLAFTTLSLRAITMAAVMILRRGPRKEGDVRRWMMHMPKFDFAAYQHIRKATLLREELIKHWNKRLSAERRVEL